MPMHEFGAGLARLVADRRVPLLGVEPVSSLRGGNASRAAFRLRFEDGTVLKGRRLESVEQASTVWTMSHAVRAAWPRAPIARVHAWYGDALLEQWLPGVLLADTPLQPADLRRAGALLGRLHGSIPVCERPVDRAWTEKSFDHAPLVAHDLLEPAVANMAVQLARDSQPQAAEWGWCHGDLCGDNLVRVPRRGFWLIDNETVGEHWFDHDLARTWYRWALMPEQWALVLDGYRQFRSTAAFDRHFAFWVVSVLLRAAAFRWRNGLDTAPPLTILALLCRERCAG